MWKPALGGMGVEGYEIRFGRSFSRRPFSVIREVNGGARTFEPEGGAVGGERAFGTYIHGIFHNFAFTGRFLNLIRKERGGLEPVSVERWSIEEEIDRFAEVVERNLDVDRILSELGL